MSKGLAAGLKPRKAMTPSRVSWEDELASERMGTLKEVPKASLTPDPGQPRKVFEPVALAELQASLEEHGLLQPILVKEVEPGAYQILAGERRWRAAMASAKIDKLSVIVRGDLDKELPVLLAQIAENIHRQDMNAVELAQAYQRVFAAVDRNADRAASVLGISKPRLYHVLSVDKAPEDIKALAQDGVTTDVNVLSGLSMLTDVNKAKADELVSQARSGALKGGGLRKAITDSIRTEKSKQKAAMTGSTAATNRVWTIEIEDAVIMGVARLLEEMTEPTPVQKRLIKRFLQTVNAAKSAE